MYLSLSTESNKSQQVSKRKSERERERATESIPDQKFSRKIGEKVRENFQRERKKTLNFSVCKRDFKIWFSFIFFVQIEKNGVRNGIFVIMRTSRGIFELCVFGLEAVFLYGVVQE